jgi:RhtB (resistance to homoserine/threonine) family protein
VLTAMVTFTFAAGLIVLLPGPDTLVVLRNLLRHGRRRAALTVAGVLTGLAVWVCAAAFGLSALLRASHDAYAALRIAGAAYLIWLGVQSLRARRPALGTPDELARPATGRGGLLGTGYGAGLATDLLNPKVGVFFVTFLPAFVPHGRPVGATSILFGAIFIVETAAYFAVLLVLAGRITGWMRDPRIQRRLDRATGLVLVGFGVRLAVEP